MELTGTKVSCNQSGCGACTVTAEIPDPNEEGQSRTKSVNSVSLSTLNILEAARVYVKSL